MAVDRRYIEITGPRGEGKTTLVERLLRSNRSRALAAARVEPDAAVDRLQSLRDDDDPELRRYRDAGAVTVARLRLPADGNANDFWASDFCGSYYEAVLLEGGAPRSLRPQLRVFVCRPPDHALYEHVTIDDAAKHEARLARYQRAQQDPEVLAQLMRQTLSMEFDLFAAAGESFESVLGSMLPRLRDDVQRVAEDVARRGPRQGTRWQLAPGYEALAFAGAIVFNVCEDVERARAEARTEEVRRIRKDDAIFKDLTGWRGDRRRVTVRSVDLKRESGAQMSSLLSRIKRAMG